MRRLRFSTRPLRPPATSSVSPLAGNGYPTSRDRGEIRNAFVRSLVKMRTIFPQNALRFAIMTMSHIHYEELLAYCSQYQGAIKLLQQYRPYLETLPSMRRPQESIIPVPLPNIRSFEAVTAVPGLASGIRKVFPLPCDIAFIMCDPEWKIKTETEIFLFIHRPEEDFSALLTRWRQTQAHLEQGYEWIMPLPHRHLLPTGADLRYPLFTVFANTPERIVQGLRGAGLPTIIYKPEAQPPESRLKSSGSPSELDLNSPYLDEAIAEMEIDLNLDFDDDVLGELS